MSRGNLKEGRLIIMENSTKKGIMLGVLLLGCGLTSFVGGMLGSSNNGTAVLKLENNKQGGYFDNKAKQKQGGMLKIYVSGAVVRPGLYDVPVGARADDAVVAAGGMMSEADPTRVNLAQKLKDGMQVNVPYRKQKSQKQYGNFNNGYNKKNGYEKSSERNEGCNLGGKVNINTADARELEALPGIGASMAQKIIIYRNKQSFNRIEDLVKVPGIGKAKLERLRDKICV